MKALSLENQKFGMLTAKEVVLTNKKRCWKCKCDCGNECIVPTFELTSKNKKSCGCLRVNKGNLIGEKFSKLLVVGECGKTKDRRKVWECLCSCGNKCLAKSKDLQLNRKIDCGCGRFERMSVAKRKQFGESEINRIINSYKRNAKNKSLVFKLTKKEIKEMLLANCYYCNKKPFSILQTRCYGEFKYNGIDRKDNMKGYEKQNTVSCCKTCNYMKKTMSEDEFLRWIKEIYENRIFHKT